MPITSSLGYTSFPGFYISIWYLPYAWSFHCIDKTKLNSSCSVFCITVVEGMRKLKMADLSILKEKLPCMKYSITIWSQKKDVLLLWGWWHIHPLKEWDAAAAIKRIRAAMRKCLTESTPTSILLVVSGWEIESPGTWSTTDAFSTFSSIWIN